MSDINNTSESNSNESGVSDKARRRLISVWTWVGAILLFAVAIYVSGILIIPLGIIVWAAVFVFMLRGPVNWLDEHGVNRTVGTVLAFALLIVVLAILLFVVFSPIFGIRDQFVDLMTSLPTYAADFQAWATDMYARYADFLQSDEVRDTVSSALKAFSEWLQSFAASSATGIVAAGTSIVNIVMCIGFGLVIAFWMLIELPNLGKEAYRIIGEKHHDDAEMLHLTVTRVVGGYLKATLIQCTVIGVVCGIMFAILDVPSPVVFGILTGLLNIIPIVGPWLGGGLAFVVSIPTSTLTAVVALVGTIVVQQLVYTFLSPKLMGDSVDIHPALTFIALMAGSGIGTAMSGLSGALVGALLAIPLAAMLKSVFVYYFEKRTGRRIVAPDGVFFRGDAADDEEVNPIADAMATTAQPTAGSTGSFSRIAELTGKLPKVELPDSDDEPKEK